MATRRARPGQATVDVYWLPLGAGDNTGLVRRSGRLYEVLAARVGRRSICDLYHSALEVWVGGDRFVIEMAPVWGNPAVDRGVVSEGPVGLPWLGHSRFFRYEVRRWRGGVILDAAEAVASPRRLSESSVQAHRLLDLVALFPTVTWGRDELRTGEMWNSNSLISWVLARSDHDLSTVPMPPGGRAPGWTAGVVAASRTSEETRTSEEGSRS